MQATVNSLYPNRVQVDISPTPGPLLSDILGPFDPRRDWEVYVAGVPIEIIAFSYDASQNVYTLLASAPFDTTAVVQVVYHMPAGPFYGER